MALRELAEHLHQQGIQKLTARTTDADRQLLRDVAMYVLFYRHNHAIDAVVRDGTRGQHLWAAFHEDWQRLLRPAGQELAQGLQCEHVLAVFFQFCRFWQTAFHKLVG